MKLKRSMAQGTLISSFSGPVVMRYVMQRRTLWRYGKDARLSTANEGWEGAFGKGALCDLGGTRILTCSNCRSGWIWNRSLVQTMPTNPRKSRKWKISDWRRFVWKVHYLAISERWSLVVLLDTQTWCWSPTTAGKAYGMRMDHHAQRLNFIVVTLHRKKAIWSVLLLWRNASWRTIVSGHIRSYPLGSE